MEKDKIEVEEYVRTKNGEIGKFKGYNNNPKSQWSCKLELQKVKTWKYCCEEYILKHSKDIIGIIEVGDYINGERIAEKYYDYANNEYNLVTKAKKHYYLDTIKSIVTKEQFKEIEYAIN